MSLRRKLVVAPLSLAALAASIALLGCTALTRPEDVAISAEPASNPSTAASPLAPALGHVLPARMPAAEVPAPLAPAPGALAAVPGPMMAPQAKAKQGG